MIWRVCGLDLLGAILQGRHLHRLRRNDRDALRAGLYARFGSFGPSILSREPPDVMSLF